MGGGEGVCSEERECAVRWGEERECAVRDGGRRGSVQ